MDGFAKLKNAFNKSEKSLILTDEQVKLLQDLLKGMLRDVVKVCEKYDLSYSLSGGSVLGAIRHNGFIPWDDDVDINMTRESYEHFKAVFEKELGEDYALYGPEVTKGYGFSGTKIVKKNTVYKTFNNVDEKGDGAGICIDVFILENTPNNPLLRYVHGVSCLALGYLLSCRKTYDYVPDLKEYADEKLINESFGMKLTIAKFIRFIPTELLAKATYRLYSLCKNNYSKYVTIPSGRKHYFGEMDKRVAFARYKKEKFEDMTINIPVGYESYMKRLYGDDYMEIPPKEKRETHPLFELKM